MLPMQMLFEKNFNGNIKLILIIIGIVIVITMLSGAFYWFEYRPTQIKKSCSKVTYTVEEVKEITQDEVDTSKKLNEECVADENNNKTSSSKIDWSSIGPSLCDTFYPIKKKTDYKPAHQEIRDANETEYQTCLRTNGL